MTLEIVSSLPVQSPFPHFVESIINKKVADVALNWLERLIDSLCSWLSSSYDEFYKQKKARVKDLNNEVTEEGSVKKATRLLFDRTKGADVKVDLSFDSVKISLKGLEVHFHNADPLAGIPEKTENLIIEEESPHYKLIKKREGALDLFWQIKKYRSDDDTDHFYVAKPISAPAVASTNRSTSSRVV